MLTDKTVNILSLDGGGTRGFLQNYFLKEFCRKAGITTPNECFDIIAGSSVGGINAAAYAYGLTPDVMCTFFREKTPWIFTIRAATDLLGYDASYASNKPNLAQKTYMLSINDPFYRAVSTESNYGDSRLKNEIANIFGEKILTDLKTPLLLTAHNYSKQHPFLFTNLSLNGIPELYRQTKIVDALMCTTAAPIYFPSYNLHLSSDPEEPDDLIIDGGLLLNNPVIFALNTALSLYPTAKRFCVLSIGTGLGSVKQTANEEESSPSDVAIKKYLNLLDISMSNAEHASDLCLKFIASLSYDVRFFYYRFNFDLDPNRDCDLDTSTSDFFDYLETQTNNKILEDEYEIGHFISRCFDREGEDGSEDTASNTTTPLGE